MDIEKRGNILTLKEVYQINSRLETMNRIYTEINSKIERMKEENVKEVIGIHPKYMTFDEFIKYLNENRKRFKIRKIEIDRWKFLFFKRNEGRIYILFDNSVTSRFTFRNASSIFK